MKIPRKFFVCFLLSLSVASAAAAEKEPLYEFFRWRSEPEADKWSSNGAPNLMNRLRASGDHPETLEEAEVAPEETTPQPEVESAKAEVRGGGEMDIVTKFLRIVESQSLLGDNCTAGTEMNLGEGVVDRYAQERFRLEAEVAVNRANFLTRLWKYAAEALQASDYLLYTSVRSMVEFDDDIFAAGNCHDHLAYKDYLLFCPFGYRLPDGTIMVKNLAVEYHYLANTSEWFYRARKSAERVIQNYTQFKRGLNRFPVNWTAWGSSHGAAEEEEILGVVYEDGKWSKPYFDCGGGNIWMLTYTVPFFGFDNDTYSFKGTSGIDIDLRRVDIDQCPPREGATELNIFASSDKCKPRTTRCESIPGLGFRRGSYRCVCKDGFYFPLQQGEEPRYYNGSHVEEEYERLVMGLRSEYEDAFECHACSEGCEVCLDGRPCVATLNWPLRTTILILTSVISAALPIVAWFTWKYGNLMVVKAASPVLLRIIILGAFFVYSTILIMYPSPNAVTCTLRVWLREMGFSLSYGALMLKTWRISEIFRVRSAKAVKISDWYLIRRLGWLVGVFVLFLSVRSLVAAPTVITGYTANNLKAFLCSTDWWDHACSIMEVALLGWGVFLCIMVRKAPSEFNESKYISLAIYNELLLSLFLNISMIFLQSPANPDLLYIIFFCHSQLTITLLLALIFGSRAYLVLKGQGLKAVAEESSSLSKPSTATKFLNRPKSQHNSGNTGSALGPQPPVPPPPADKPSVEMDVQEEFQRLYLQLESMKERNLRLGNRHLADKISAMQQAAVREEEELKPKEKKKEEEEPVEAPPLLQEPMVGTEAANGVEMKALRDSPNHVSANSVTGSEVTTANSASPGSRGRGGPHRRHHGHHHARRHRIIINLDDKTRFTDEITV